jgi:hypothetical protein
MTDPKPEPGQMFLFDYMQPPLLDNSYRIGTETQVHLDNDLQHLPANLSYFNIEGPRFNLPAPEIAGVFPPRNGHGAFEETLPHLALGRRTLPWERLMDSQNLVGRPAGMPANIPIPWMALLLFEDGEYKINSKVPLENAVPSDVLSRLGLGNPAGITCDTVEADSSLVASLMPSVEELALLSHVRLVSTDDRELSAGDSDGWFAVVMSNRVPRAGAKYRACLVSVEERTDLVPRDPPPTAIPLIQGFEVLVQEGIAGSPSPPTPLPLSPGEGLGVREEAVVADEELFTPAHSTIYKAAPSNRVLTSAVSAGLAEEFNLVGTFFPRTVQLILLFSWQFECIEAGTFQHLMQQLDVGMIGKVHEKDRPSLADTGHLPIQLQDRAGVPETVWYRGPLVPFQLTRDPLGPYHTADQARRVTPETGTEDISYAAALEVGRLLAVADSRLGQDLMRWRRDAYRFSARKDSLGAVQTALSMPFATDLHRPFLPVMSVAAVKRFVEVDPPRVDPFGLDVVERAVGLDPTAVRQAWRLDSVEQAAAVLGGDAGALGAVSPAPVQTPRSETTLDQVAKDAQGLDQLAMARDRILENTQVKMS